MKTVLYGCGRNLKNSFTEYILGHDVIAIVDRNKNTHGVYKGIKVIGLDLLKELEFDKLLITLDDYSACLSDLEMLNISNDKINIPYLGGHVWKKVEIVPLYEGGLRCDFDGVKFIVRTKSDYGVMESIFNNNSWDFYCNDKCIVMDVGMNIGLASLFFANMDNVDKVYGYEPFPATYNEAIENYKLNPTLAHKIECYNCGLSDKNSTISCLYDPEYTTNMRTDDHIRQHGKSEYAVNIELKDSYELLQEIIMNPVHATKKRC